MESRHEKLNPYLTHDNMTRVSSAIQWLPFEKKTTFKSGISIVILNLNKPELICPLVESLVKLQKNLESRHIPLEIIIGDTGSTDQLVKASYQKHRDHIFLGEGLKYHFSKNNNEMFQRFVTRDLVLFMNNDIIFRSDPVDLFVEIAHRFQTKPKTGIVGATLLYDDLRLQHHGIDFFHRGPLRGLSYHPGHREQMPKLTGVGKTFWSVPAVTGAFLAIKSEVFQQIGGFDESYRTECQDIDLCLMVKNLGLNIDLLVTDGVIHLENATREKGSEDWVDRQKFVRQWSSFVEVIVE